jgi:hypothetical protein
VSRMVDEKKLKQTLVSFRGFRSHVFGSITEAMVAEYHSILHVLQLASGDNLSCFHIPPSMMLPRVITPVRYAHSSVRSFHWETQYTSAKYCDKKFFNDRADRLSEHFAEQPTADAGWNGWDPKGS